VFGKPQPQRGRPPQPPAPWKRAAGFSFIELLIVTALILIMYVMLYSPSARAHQTKMKAVCARNLRNIYTALQTFDRDQGGRLPVVTNAVTSEAPLSLLIPRFTTGSEFFICPGSGDRALPDATPFADRRISYAYYMGRKLSEGAGQPLMSDKQVNAAPKTAGEPLFSPDGKKPGNNHHRYGGNVLFCDGSIQTSPARSAFSLSFPTNVILLNPKP
jgi:prepilin-type processing-associated H-X9-DG protein